MMPRQTHADERELMIGACQHLVTSGVLSLSLHGNISMRIPDTELLLMTGSSLAGVQRHHLAVVDLDNRVVEGEVAPAEHEVIPMHTALYKERPELGSVIHTHSPHATAFAVASEPLPCVAESLARWGVVEQVPVAGWAPRGSEESISNIVDTVRQSARTEALLLQNHGVLVWGTNLNIATRRTIALEEAAHLAVLAQAIGRPRVLDLDEASAAAARREEYLSVGGARHGAST